MWGFLNSDYQEMSEEEYLPGNIVIGSLFSECNGRVQKKIKGKEKNLVFIQTTNQGPESAL